MDLFNLLRIVGISLGFIVLIIVFITTNNSDCFNPLEIFITYLLLVYTIIIEIFSLIFDKIELN